MKKTIVAIIFLVFSVHAYAANSTSYRLMGKGVQKKGTHETLALTCIEGEQECKKMQFALFHENLSVEFIGPKFDLPKAPDTEREEQAIKAQMAYFFATNHNPMIEEEKSARFRNTASWMVMIGATAAGATIGTMTIATAGLIMLPIAAAGIFLRAFPPASMESFIINSGEYLSVDRLNDQTGWNWPEQPKVIKARKFDRVVEHIQSQTHFYTNVSSTIRRAEKKIRKLERQGVEFPRPF